MEEFTVFASDSDRLFKQVAAHYDAPAFARRARRVEDALQDLLDRCQTQRQAWLDPVRARLKELLAVLSAPCHTKSIVEVARALEIALPEFTSASASARQRQRALVALTDSVARFNRRWAAYLLKLDLAPLNCLREDYNRYYVLEKECALRSPRVARIGFVPLQPLTRQQLEERFPRLPGLPGDDAGAPIS